MTRSNRQNGAVLAFCLVMLLLLTLAGTRMIQQNKQQLEIANSMRQSTQQFANAEGLLAEAKNVINAKAVHIDPTGTAINNSEHQCVPTNSFKQNILLAGTTAFDNNALLSGGNAIILKVRCKSESGLEQVCSSYETGTLKCKPTSGDVACSGETIDSVTIAKFNLAADICYQDYDPQADNPNSDAIVKGKCPKEIYTIQAISTDVNGTTRKIVSDHVVGCGS